MRRLNLFLSLKWKFALSFGVILIVLFALYSYFVYEEAQKNYEHSRSVAQKNQINIAQALTRDSFDVLGHFAESVVPLHTAPAPPPPAATLAQQMEYKKHASEEHLVSIIQLFDKHWIEWQIIWQLENIVLYNQQGSIIRRWGRDALENPELVLRVLSQERPEIQVKCLEECFQKLVTPIFSGGAIGISLSLADTILAYKDTIHSDIGIINNTQTPSLSAVTNPIKNKILLGNVLSTHKFETFFNQTLRFQQDNEYYEILAFPVTYGQQAPYYVIINNITKEYNRLQKKTSSLAITGLIGLLSTILILIITLHFMVARVVQLSKALPMIAQHKYQSFRNLNKPRKLIFIDEIERLSRTTTQVVDQLEGLRSEAVISTKELQKERDFSTQLIDTAPIIIITQNAEGVVLSINQQGLKEIHLSAADIIGKKFSALLPKNETEHIKKLKILRTQSEHKEVRCSGRLAVRSEQFIHIDWTHTTFHKKNSDQEAAVLSLGVDVTEKRLANEQLVQMANHDQLTGLNNRRHFQRELDKMLANARRYDDHLALFYLDLDQFKVINDTHGHKAGDELLQAITNILKVETRETDLLSRIGGDEFALVIPESTLQGIEYLADKLLQALKNFDYKVNEHPYSVSFSIGIAIFPEHGKTQQELLANADLAMYHAKKTGRSRYHVYSPDVEYQAKLTEQLRWKHIIQQAIEESLFILFYQPILDIKNKKISHYECLLRLEQADGTILMPGDFIGHAEDTGIIDQLDRVVLKLAIAQHLAFQKIGRDVRLAINLSGHSMSNTEILPYIEELLQLPGVKPELLIFEITETSAVSNFLSAKEIISSINAFGSHFALDDFGVGFSSFYYLRSLPVDYVKIDGAFVKQMDVNEDDRTFVKVLTEISQAFDKKIIAEFVENSEILNLLDELGVDYAQGYYISRPLRDPLDLSHVRGLE